MNWYKIIKFADKKNYLVEKMGYPKEIVEWAERINQQVEPKNKYLQWIVSLAAKKNVIPGEDDSKIIEKLQIYDKLKKLKKLNKLPVEVNGQRINDPTNIFSFKNYGLLAQFLEPYKEKEPEGKREKGRRLTEEGAEIIYSKNGVDIIKITSEEAAGHLCRDTEWCVKDPSFYNNYGPPFYMFQVNNSPYALLHEKSGSFKDIYDDSMISEKMGPIGDALEFFIDNKITSIEDYPEDDPGYYDWVQTEISEIFGFLRNRKEFNKLAEKASRGDMEAKNKLYNDLSNSFKHKYTLLSNENKTEEIQNFVASEWNKNLRDDFKNISDMTPANRNHFYKNYFNVPEELYKKLDLEINKIIMERILEELKGNPYLWEDFPDKIKKRIDKNYVKELFKNLLYEKEPDFGRSERLLKNFFNYYPPDIKEMFSDEEILNFIIDLFTESIIPNKNLSNLNELWKVFPERIKKRIPEEIKQQLAKSVLAEYWIKLNYNDSKQHPQLPEDLLKYIPEEQQVEMWKNFALWQPENYFPKEESLKHSVIPENIREKLNPAEIAQGYMKRLSKFPSEYFKLPEEAKKYIDPESLLPFIYERIEEEGLGKFSYGPNLVEQFKKYIDFNYVISIIEKRLGQFPQEFGSLPDEYKQYINKDILSKSINEWVSRNINFTVSGHYTSVIDLLQRIPSSNLQFLSPELRQQIKTIIENHWTEQMNSPFMLKTTVSYIDKEFLDPQFYNSIKLRQEQEKEQIYQQQILRTAKNNNWYKTSQQIPIQIVSYMENIGELKILYPSGKTYTYYNVNPYNYDKLFILLRKRNYKAARDLLNSLAENNRKNIDYTKEDKDKMLNELYDRGYLN